MQEEVLFPILELRKEFNGFLKKTKNSDFNNVNEDLPLVFDIPFNFCNSDAF